MKAIRLRTEYLNNPIGVDFKHPRLMWNVEGGVRQTAYQIVTDRWDSGRVESSSMQAAYPKGLHDRERVSRKLRVWDEYCARCGKPADGEWYSEIERFEKEVLEARV